MMWGISHVLAETTSYPTFPFNSFARFMVDPSFSPANAVIKVFANSSKVWKAGLQDEIGLPTKWGACNTLDVLNQLLPNFSLFCGNY